MPNSDSCGVNKLPLCVLTLEILLKLPIKSIIRCGAVCKYWNNLISDPCFINIYSKGPHQIRIPNADQTTVVVYFTSLAIVRPTFEDCNAVRSILRSLGVSIDERDLSMDLRFTKELQRIMGRLEKSKLSLPRVFVGGRYIGGAAEVRRLHVSGELKKCMEEGLLPVDAEIGTCEACGGCRFILCYECSGSRKCYDDEMDWFRSCTSCNENGLVMCTFCPI